MITAARHFAGAAVLALALLAPPVLAQEEAPLESLVLVLNLLSSTHARPATGVVLATPATGNRDTGNSALVMVPASFVGAGDDIIVLDGGNDILRNGRPTRTAARSASAGVAVLEVEGLSRPGVSLAAGAWPVPGETYEFLAWPGAGALAEGASLIRRSYRPESEAPQVSGPLFDRCGNLAAMFLAGDEGHASGSPAVIEFLAGFGIEASQKVCTSVSPVIEDEAGLAAIKDEAEAGQNNTGQAAENAPGQASPPGETVSSLALTANQKTALLIAWLVLGLLAFMHYRRRSKRKAVRGNDTQVVLERQTDTGQRFHHRLKLDKQRRSAQLERHDRTLEFRVTGAGLEVSTPEDGQGDSAGFVLNGTPCLGGERLLVREGDQICLGDETFVVVGDPEAPKQERT